MPAEWLPHAATWLSWPRNQDTWPHNLPDVRHEFVELVRAIAAGEPARVMAGPGPDWDSADSALRGIDNVEIIPIQTNDAWARDYAPTFLVTDDGAELVAVDWHYNAWGGKYPPYDDDQRVAGKIAAWLKCQHLPVDLCLEGGALEIDEQNILLCTRTCAFDPHRNPGRTEVEIEVQMKQALQLEHIVWLHGDALIGDDTDGHIDQLARFTPNGTILYAWTDDQADAQQIGLARNLHDLQSGLATLGDRRSLIPLPIPDPVFFRNVQIPACYCNFYITNSHVLVPAFGASQDDQARAIIAEQFPRHEVVSLPSTNLTVGLGSFHCLTQQQPQLSTRR